MRSMVIETMATVAAIGVGFGVLANGADLPDPDGKPADMTKPVQVFILLGQSNMLGFGKVAGADKDGTLEHALHDLFHGLGRDRDVRIDF